MIRLQILAGGGRQTLSAAAQPILQLAGAGRIPEIRRRPADIVDIDNYSVSVQGRKGGHTVYQNNGSQFVVLREGETLSSVAGEFGLSEKKLAKYNDFDAGTQPRPGDMVYIRAKNKRSQNGKLIHIAKDGETLHGISQMYGIRLKNLCSINRRSRDSQVSAGQQIRLM